MESVFYGFKTQNIMTEQNKKYVAEALEYALHKCIDVNGDAETHYNTLANAIEVVKNCSIPDVVNRRKLLLAFAKELQEIGLTHYDDVEKITDIYMGKQKLL